MGKKRLHYQPSFLQQLQNLVDDLERQEELFREKAYEEMGKTRYLEMLRDLRLHGNGMMMEAFARSRGYL